MLILTETRELTLTENTLTYNKTPCHCSVMADVSWPEPLGSRCGMLAAAERACCCKLRWAGAQLVHSRTECSERATSVSMGTLLTFACGRAELQRAEGRRRGGEHAGHLDRLSVPLRRQPGAGHAVRPRDGLPAQVSAVRLQPPGGVASSTTCISTIDL